MDPRYTALGPAERDALAISRQFRVQPGTVPALPILLAQTHTPQNADATSTLTFFFQVKELAAKKKEAP